MSDNYNDVHLHDERNDGRRQLAEEADFLHDWRISLDERLGITNTKRLYELLGRVLNSVPKNSLDSIELGDHTPLDTTIKLGDVRLARELLR